MYNHVINMNMVNYANLVFVGEYEKENTVSVCATSECSSCAELKEELELLKVIFNVQ